MATADYGGISATKARDGAEYVKDGGTREAVFISHANPESNAFARWLGAKLAAMGFAVWADVMNLRGGADWARDLETALRHKSIKMLLACTPAALDKQGVRNEIEIGAQLGKQLSDPEFIIPLRLEEYEPHFRIAQAQYVDFKESWAAGFTELIELLVNVHKIPRKPNRPMTAWLTAQSVGATRLVKQPERLASNWLMFRKAPAFVRYCEPRSGFSLDRFQDRTLHRWPVVPFGAGVVTFASPDRRGFISDHVPARVVHSVKSTIFLSNGWKQLQIEPGVARRQFSDLGNQAFDDFLRNRRLTSYEGANGRLTWWGNIRTAPLATIPFDWPRHKGRRQIIGQSGKRGVHWHYGLNGEIRTFPVRHLRLSARLIFSDNGLDALGDVKRMHKLRRSFAKSWRNARWRDMLMAFLWWIADGKTEISLQVSHRQSLTLAVPAVAFSCPVSALHAGEEPPDDDDPDVEADEWDEWEGNGEGDGDH